MRNVDTTGYRISDSVIDNNNSSTCHDIYRKSDNAVGGCDNTQNQSVFPLPDNTYDRSSINSSSELSSSIYRYEFTSEFTEKLFRFSKLHQCDERDIFKKSWELWREENTEIVNNEIMRLEHLNYTGDILDKMFKSARYYFRKKGTKKKAPILRKQYTSLPKSLLDKMDETIYFDIQNNLKPSDSFVEFCKNNKDILRETIEFLNKKKVNDLEEIENKVKKTYKNRYFVVKSK